SPSIDEQEGVGEAVGVGRGVLVEHRHDGHPVPSWHGRERVCAARAGQVGGGFSLGGGGGCYFAVERVNLSERLVPLGEHLATGQCLVLSARGSEGGVRVGAL